MDTYAPSALEPIPVTVLAGFLGSGKTTLLNRLLHDNHGQKVAVIVNEFGSVGIDGALVSGGERFVELDNGCLCCALNDDLHQALRDLVAHNQSGGRKLDRIVIESTGLAAPLPVAWTATRQDVSQALRVDAIVTVVDALHVERALAESQEARVQIEQADLLVLNKMDLVQDGGAAAQAAVRRHNEVAPLTTCQQGEVPWAWVMAAPGVREPSRAAASAQNTEPAEHGGDAHPHPHLHPHHDAQATGSFASWSYVQPASVVFDEARCEALAFAVPPEVIRFKALVRVDDAEGTWLLVHGVGSRVDLRFMEPTRAPTQSAWVFFGKNLDQGALANLCAEFLAPRGK